MGNDQNPTTNTAITTAPQRVVIHKADAVRQVAQVKVRVAYTVGAVLAILGLTLIVIMYTQPPRPENEAALSLDALSLTVLVIAAIIAAAGALLDCQQRDAGLTAELARQVADQSIMTAGLQAQIKESRDALTSAHFGVRDIANDLRELRDLVVAIDTRAAERLAGLEDDLKTAHEGIDVVTRLLQSDLHQHRFRKGS